MRRSSDLEDELRNEKLRKTDEDILEENDKLKIENRKFYENMAKTKKEAEIAKKNADFFQNSADNYLKRIEEMEENDSNGFAQVYTEETMKQIKLFTSIMISISNSMDSLEEDDKDEMYNCLEPFTNVFNDTISKLNESSKAA